MRSSMFDLDSTASWSPADFSHSSGDYTPDTSTVTTAWSSAPSAADHDHDHEYAFSASQTSTLDLNLQAPGLQQEPGFPFFSSQGSAAAYGTLDACRDSSSSEGCTSDAADGGDEDCDQCPPSPDFKTEPLDEDFFSQYPALLQAKASYDKYSKADLDDFVHFSQTSAADSAQPDSDDDGSSQEGRDLMRIKQERAGQVLPARTIPSSGLVKVEYQEDTKSSTIADNARIIMGISSNQEEASLQAATQALSAGAAPVIKLDGQGMDSLGLIDTAWPGQSHTSPLMHGQGASQYQIPGQTALLPHTLDPLSAACVSPNLLANPSLAVVTSLPLSALHLRSAAPPHGAQAADLGDARSDAAAEPGALVLPDLPRADKPAELRRIVGRRLQQCADKRKARGNHGPTGHHSKAEHAFGSPTAPLQRAERTDMFDGQRCGRCVARRKDCIVNPRTHGKCFHCVVDGATCENMLRLPNTTRQDPSSVFPTPTGTSAERPIQQPASRRRKLRHPTPSPPSPNRLRAAVDDLRQAMAGDGSSKMSTLLDRATELAEQITWAPSVDTAD